MRDNLFSNSEPRLHRSQPEQQNNEYRKQVTTTTLKICNRKQCLYD